MSSSRKGLLSSKYNIYKITSRPESPNTGSIGNKIKIKEIKKPIMDIFEENEKIMEQLGHMQSTNPFESTKQSLVGRRTKENLINLIEICTKKINESEYHHKALHIRANSLMRLGQIEKSLEDCNKILEVDPNNIDALYLRGCISQKSGRIELAIEDFSKVLVLDPNHVNAALARASCYNFLGDFDKAIDDYETGLMKDKKRGILRRRLNHVNNDNKGSQDGDDDKENNGIEFGIFVNGNFDFEDKENIIKERRGSEDNGDGFEDPGENEDSYRDYEDEDDSEIITETHNQKSISTTISNSSNLKRTSNKQNLEEADR